MSDREKVIDAFKNLKIILKLIMLIIEVFQIKVKLF